MSKEDLILYAVFMILILTIIISVSINVIQLERMDLQQNLTQSVCDIANNNAYLVNECTAIIAKQIDSSFTKLDTFNCSKVLI